MSSRSQGEIFGLGNFSYPTKQRFLISPDNTTSGFIRNDNSVLITANFWCWVKCSDCAHSG